MPNFEACAGSFFSFSLFQKRQFYFELRTHSAPFQKHKQSRHCCSSMCLCHSCSPYFKVTRVEKTTAIHQILFIAEGCALHSLPTVAHNAFQCNKVCHSLCSARGQAPLQLQRTARPMQACQAVLILRRPSQRNRVTLNEGLNLVLGKGSARQLAADK